MFGKATRVVAVVALVATLIGVVPQSHARAWAPPVPVAPPVTGLCSTPWTALACVTVVGGKIVWDWAVGSQLIGQGPAPDGSGWCVMDTGHMFPEGSSSCSPEVGVTPTEALVEEVAEKFVPTVLEEFNPEHDYFWYPVSPETACTESGVCIERVLTGPGGAPNTYRIVAEFSPSETVPMCATQSGSFFYGTGGSGVIDFPWSRLEVPFSECTMVMPHRAPSTPAVVGASPTPWGPVVYLRSNANSGSCHSSNPGHRGWDYALGGEGVSQLTAKVVHTNQNCVLQVLERSGDGSLGRVGVVTWDDSGGGTVEYVEVLRENAFFEGVYQGRYMCRDTATGLIAEHVAQGPGAFPVTAKGFIPITGCPSGTVPTQHILEYCDVNSDACIRIASWTGNTTDMTPTMQTCFDRLASDNPCSMWLEKWNGTEWEECVPDDNCVGWWSQPNRETHYRCGWGGDYFAASQCVPLRDFYDGTDKDVATHNPTDPNPDPTAGGDPVQIGGPVPPVSAQPTRTWYGRIIREWATGTIEGMNQACWPQGWGLLNPLQWVLRPTMCALAWAFVPQTALELRLERIMEEVEVRLGLSPSMLLFTLPTVGSACGWGFSAWEGEYLEVPQVNVIPCPSELGPTGPTWAGTSRALGYVVLGFGAWQLVHRWLTLRPHPGVDSEDGGVIV